MGIELKGKIIDFPNKKLQNEKVERKENILNTVNFILENFDGDFAIVFKTKDVEHLFDGVCGEEFIVGLSNIKTRSSKKDDYFFSKFSSRQYLDLDN